MKSRDSGIGNRESEKQGRVGLRAFPIPHSQFPIPAGGPP